MEGLLKTDPVLSLSLFQEVIEKSKARDIPIVIDAVSLDKIKSQL